MMYYTVSKVIYKVIQIKGPVNLIINTGTNKIFLNGWQETVLYVNFPLYYFDYICLVFKEQRYLGLLEIVKNYTVTFFFMLPNRPAKTVIAP